MINKWIRLSLPASKNGDGFTASRRRLQHLSRADFLKSVGLYVMRDYLVLVRMRKNFQTVSLIEQEARELPLRENRQAISELTGWIGEDVREIALKAEHDSHERALRQAVVSLLPHFNSGRDSLYICVPQEQAIVQQILLPQAAEVNLQRVLEYEIERQLPFGRDEIYYDFVPVEKKGDRIALLLFAIPKKSIGNILDVLSSFGITPTGVETTTTALANYMSFCTGDLTSRAVIVGRQNRVLDMVGVQGDTNGWKQTSKLLFAHWLPEADWAERPAKELLNEALRESPKLFGWGEVGEFLQGPRGEPLPYEDLESLGNERLTRGREIAHPQVLPAIGCALRGLREDSFTVNFLKREGAAESRGRLFSPLNAALAALLLLSIIAWGVSYPIKDEVRLRQLQKENRRLEPTVEALRRQEAQLQKARKEASVLLDLDQRRGEVLRVMDELSKMVPTNTYLLNLRYKGGVLELQGNAENASALIPLLERSPVFENVAFNAPSNRGRDNRETFSLKADLERAKQRVTKP